MSRHGIIKEKKHFGADAAVYAFTTENLAGYLPHFVWDNKRVLTVCGSGDQIGNLALLGAEEILAFDINKNALSWAELKLAALKALSFQEYLDFFLRHDGSDTGPNTKALDWVVFARLEPQLSAASVECFRCASSNFATPGFLFRESDFFNNCYDNNQCKLRSNLYLSSESAFLEARQRLGSCRVNLLEQDIRQICACNKLGLFDAVLLSNLADYSSELFPNQADSLLPFSQCIVQPLFHSLRRSGFIVAAYMYAAAENGGTPLNPHSQVDVAAERMRCLGVSAGWYQEFGFDSVIPGCRDMVTVIGRER